VADEDVAIIGAGIAGLVLAARLSRSGIACRVYEQAPVLRAIGAGIQLAPNAVRVLYRLGLADALAAEAVQPTAIELRRWHNGQTLARIELGAACLARYGVPYLTAHRADLHAALVAAVPAGTVRLDARCESIVDTDDAVELRFAGGDSVRAGLVVGADGIHSVVRAALVADRPRFSGQTIFRGIVPAAQTPPSMAEPAVRLYLGPAQHLVCYPIAGGRLVNVAATVPADDWRLESWTASGDPDVLDRAYQGWTGEVRALLGALDPSRLQRWALHDRDEIDLWYGRRSVLVGDAAHPMLPFLAQGANQAIDDAAVLAACLAADLSPAALARYAALRKPRATEVQRLSRRNNERLHIVDGPAQAARDDELNRSQRLAEQDWLYGYDADAVTVPAQDGGSDG
jgi:salicylate hydroxylase